KPTAPTSEIAPWSPTAPGHGVVPAPHQHTFGSPHVPVPAYPAPSSATRPWQCWPAALRLSLEFLRIFFRCGFIGRWGGGLVWLGGLGGQEQDGQESPCGGDAAGDEGADDEAAQEGVGGGVLQRQPEGRVAEGRDLAGGHVGGADGLVRDRRD